MSFNDADYISGILDDIKDGVSSALTAISRPAGRVVKSPGDPVWDCDGLYVWPELQNALVGTQLSQGPAKRQIKYALRVHLTLLRCITVATQQGLPTSGMVDADGSGLAEDAWTVWKTLNRGMMDGTLIDGNTCVISHIQPLTFYPVSSGGGLAGFSTIIEVAL